MFISLTVIGVKVTASKMIGKHKCSENKHRNNYHNINYVVSTAGVVGQTNSWQAMRAEEAVVSDCSESAVAADF
jgi:predicted FMN-binding regulatory protein PaiB